MKDARLHTCLPDWTSMIRTLLLGLLLAALAGCGGSDDTPKVLSITQQPTDQATVAGGNVSFSVAGSAVGAIATYQWQILSGGIWTDIAGATAPTLTINGATLSQSGTQYRAVVSGNNQSLITVPVVLTVTPAPQPPAITVHPADQSVTEPATATFNVTASGTAPLTYQWQRNVAGTWTAIAGATAASYTTAATVRASDNGAQLRAVVTNSVGAATSNVATLTVSPAPVAPAFTTQPVNVTVTEPATASFTVAATGTPAPTLQWQFSTDSGSTWNNVSTGSGATATTYTTAATTTAMTGWRYRAVATNTAGSATSSSATLTVNAQLAAPIITQQPANATVPSESTATFSVVATGAPSPTYQWQRQAPGGGGFFNITGATGPSYTTPAVFFLDDGDVTETGAQYRVVVTNSQGSVTSNAASLTVTSLPLTGFTQLSAGYNHVLGLRSDGSVWAWGSNGYGQVGRTCSACSPRPVNGLSGTFTRVLARGDTSFAIRSDGTVWAWGYNGQGQLGRNLAAGTNSSTPAPVLRQSDLQPLSGIVGLTMTNAAGFGGDASVLAWTAAGVAWKWGHPFIEPNLGGYPNSLNLTAVPHGYFDGSTAAHRVERAAAGNDGTVIAIDGTGAAVFWACNGAGCSFGTTPVTPFTSLGFVGTAIDIAIENNRVALVRSDNTLWGQAYQASGIWNGLNQPLVQLAVGGPVAKAAVGRFGAVTYALGTNGTVYAAGEDGDGQLGDGTAGGFRATFAAVMTMNDATLVAVGHANGLALRAGGAIWAWGNNAQRVNGTTDSSNRPIGSIGWVQTEAAPFAARGR